MDQRENLLNFLASFMTATQTLWQQGCHLFQAVKRNIVVAAVTHTIALILVCCFVLFLVMLAAQLFICLQLSSIVDFRVCPFHFSPTYFYPIMWQLFLHAFLRPKKIYFSLYVLIQVYRYIYMLLYGKVKYYFVAWRIFVAFAIR